MENDYKYKNNNNDIDSIDVKQHPDYENNLNENENDFKSLTRKVDLKLIPFLALIYLFCFLDRVNIGYARLYKLEADLNLSQLEYSWTLSIFFVGYVLFEVPSNLLLKKYSPL